MTNLESDFLLRFHLYGLQKYPEPIQELKFHETRKWRFDFAWPENMIAVECEGGTWTGGRHTRGSGYEKDCIKYNTAIFMGWRVLRFTSGMICNPDSYSMLFKMLGIK